MHILEVLIATPSRCRVESEFRGNLFIPSNKEITSERDVMHRNGMKWGLRDKDTDDTDQWFDAGEWFLISETVVMTIVDISSDIHRTEAEENLRMIFPCHPGIHRRFSPRNDFRISREAPCN
jgi:hypothetical protein